MGDGVDRIHEKIRSFQKKYYLNIFIRGAILTVSIVLLYFLLAAVLEYNFWMQPWARFTIFVSFFGVVIYCIYRFLKEPLQWWIAKRGMGQEESARIIGGYFPEVKDRLLNLLQLTDQQSKSALAYASIRQKTVHLEPLSFESIVDLNENRRYLKFLLVPFAILLILLAVNQQIITNSTTRILKFTQEFSPAAPFSFEILNESLIAFHSEDYSLNVKLAGTAVPENAYLVVDGQRFKMQSSGGGSFSYNFENVQEDFTFQLEAAGFYSSNYNVRVVNRPELTGFRLSLDFPDYIGRKDEVLNNAGNIEVPEGTTVQWNIAGSNTLHAGILFQSSKESFPFQMSDNEHFKYSRRFLESDGYEIILKNNNSENRERISYRIDVVKDQFPQIAVNSLKDSILYRTVVLGGMLSDDYGLTELALFYKIKNDKGEEKTERSARLSIVKDQAQQSFIYNWPLDSLQLKAGDQLEYYLKVWDNDAVSGRKATKSATYNLFMPTEGALLTDINKTRSETQQKMDQSAGKADKLQEQIDQAAQRLKGKQSLDWQDKKMLQDIVQQKNNLDQMLDQLKEQNNMLQQKKEAFTEQDERIKEKAEQIQKLLNELLDEETKKLFEELQKLLKENADVNQLQKLLEKLNQNTSNLEKELDRILELFKEIEFESKVENTVEKLKSQIEEQKKLIEKHRRWSKRISQQRGKKLNRKMPMKQKTWLRNKES